MANYSYKELLKLIKYRDKLSTELLLDYRMGVAKQGWTLKYGDVWTWDRFAKAKWIDKRYRNLYEKYKSYLKFLKFYYNLENSDERNISHHKYILEQAQEKDSDGHKEYLKIKKIIGGENENKSSRKDSKRRRKQTKRSGKGQKSN